MKAVRHKSLLITVSAVSATLGLAACGSSAKSASPPKGTTSGSSTGASLPAGPIKVGMIDSQTGAVAGAGTADFCGAEVAVKAINAAGGVLGHDIQLTTADDQSSPAVAAQQGQKLTGEGIRLFVGGSTSTDVLAEEPYFKNVSAFFTGGTTKDAKELSMYPYVVRVNSSSAQDMAYTAKYLSSAYPKGTLVMLGLEGTFTQDEFALLSSDVDRSHFTSLQEIYAPATTTSWSSYISKVESYNPSVVVNAIYGTDQPVSWYREAYSAGLRVPEFGAPGILSSTVVSAAGTAATSGLVGADTWVTFLSNEANTKLRADYAKYSSSTAFCGNNSFNVEGKQMETTYSQVLLLADAIGIAKSEAPPAITSTIKSGSWNLPGGTTHFGSDGQGTVTYYLYKVSNGNEIPFS